MSETRLIFDEGPSDEEMLEARLRGRYTGASIELPDGRRLRAAFYTPLRLAQTVEDILRFNNYVAIGMLIVLPEVTKETMIAAASRVSLDDVLPRSPREREC